MKCVKCFNPISEGRIRAFPTAKTCVTCSDTARIGCHTVITGKNTYSEIQLVDQETSANLYRMQSRKGFGVATGVKFNFKK